MSHHRTEPNRKAVLRPLTFTVLLGMALAGCSGGLASVSGKVTYKGKEVTGGTLTFAPVGGEKNPEPGKPASGAIQKDGTYVLGTNGPTDGAVIGQHKVYYSPPTVEPPKGKSPTIGDVFKSPYDGLVPKYAEVEVKPGSNVIDIELVPPDKQIKQPK